MNIPFSPPDITQKEIDKVCEVLKSGWITTGPETKSFEKNLADYMGTKKVVCLSSATAAMEMTLRMFGIGKGDEVITSAYTYTATAAAICHTGATPVLVDIAGDGYDIDYEAIKDKINEKTKAIMPVDIAGHPCDYDRVIAIANDKKDMFKASDNKYQKALNRILVLSDCAHGLGAVKNGKKTGMLADFTAFSFHAVKNLTTAEGGCVTWKGIDGIDDEEIYKEYMLLSLHGQSKDALSKTKAGAWEYDIMFPGYKCNMTDIQAAIGNVQLERYDDLLDKRQILAKRYEDNIDKINEKYGWNIKYVKAKDGDYISSAHLFLTYISGITTEQRNKIIELMSQKGVATNVHYKPLPMLTAYKNLGFVMEDYPNAYDKFKHEITLPLHTLLDEEKCDYVTSCLCECMGEVLG